MKKLVLTVLILALPTAIFAQVDFGLKGGVNYNFTGDLSQAFQETGDNAVDVITTGADNKAGFHLGLWTRINFSGLYIRPELVYTELNSSYNNSFEDINTDFKTKKIDIPVLLGAKVIGPLHIFGGPSFQYVTKSNFSQDEFTNIKTKDFTAGLQLGLGLEFGRLGIDARWEKGFENDVDGQFLNSSINVDNRPNQIIFGISYRLNGGK